MVAGATFTPLRRAALKPGDCTAISYSPGSKNGAVYWPELSDTAGILVPVWISVTVTFAPGLPSRCIVTRPLMVPRNS